MSATNFKTVNQTYRQLIGNGTYSIPRFQRDYSWTDEEWDDLWEDILNVIRDDEDQVNDDAHYMGYLVLQSLDDKEFFVIDGQQRLTTLSIIVLAALKNLNRIIKIEENPTNNNQRLEQLRNTYIGYLDPITLQSKNKLTLNRNNDSFYKTYLVPLTEKMPQRGIKTSEHSLRKASDWFDKKISEYIRNEQDKGIKIATIIEKISNSLFFTVITVNNELNAYKVFETLNARGVRLSSTDLLKNYLFSVIHKHRSDEHELSDLERNWDNLVDRLGAESFPDFLRIFWNGRYQFVRHSELFKRVRENVSNRGDVFQLIRDMDEDIDIYLTLTSPSTATSFPPNIKKYAEQLKMFSVKQPYSLLMACYRHLEMNDFEKVLKACVNISFRYNVIGGLHTGDQERAYHKAAMMLNSNTNENFTSKTVIQMLESIYVKDDVFKASFTDKIIKTTSARNKKVVTYIFNEIANHKSEVNLDLSDEKYTIEHIFPQNAEAGWDDYEVPEANNMVYRLGNMTLCEKSINQDMGNKPFQSKKDILKNSKLILNEEISQSSEWKPIDISNRQKRLAKAAAHIWRIDQLS